MNENIQIQAFHPNLKVNDVDNWFLSSVTNRKLDPSMYKSEVLR